MFLTHEEYENWKKTILEEHIKKTRNHRVSVGHDGVLVLLGDGRLFGFGNNTQGQYCPHHIGEIINQPEKIADNVISMAAGYNYSIYLDAQGKVHFLGNSGIPYKERFDQGNLIFKEVYARNNEDSFWAIDKNGKIYFWGDVGRGNKKLLKTLEPIETQHVMNYKKFWYEAWNISGKYRTGETMLSNSIYPHLEKIKLSIKSSADYAKFIHLYGECNLEIKFPVEDSRIIKDGEFGETLTDNNCFYQYRHEEYMDSLQPEIYFVNKYIFLPLEPTYDINMLKNLPSLLFEEFKEASLKKSVVVWENISYDKLWACILKSGKCYICWVNWYDDNYRIIDGEIIKLMEMDNISDCASYLENRSCCACKSYFIDHSKKLWRLNVSKVEYFTLYKSKKFKKEDVLNLVYEF